MAKLIRKLFVFLLPIMIIMASINYIVDPGLIFHDGEFERKVAEGILEEKNVMITSNRNERKEVRYIINNLNFTPDGLIVGSSRSMCISGESMGFFRGLNTSVSGATVYDIIAIIGMYNQQDILPKTIVINIDPWLFNENSGDVRYREILDEYNEFATTLGLPLETQLLARDEMNVRQLFSPTYFQQSIQDLNYRHPKPEYTTESECDSMLKLRDGSIVYGKTFRERTVDEVNQSVVNVINSESFYQSENYDILSVKIQENLAVMIEYLQDKEINIIFVLTPFHPMAYEYLKTQDKYKLVIDSERFVKEYAIENNIVVKGSYDPRKLNVDEEDFYDFMHLKRDVVQEIVQLDNYEDEKDDF